jgi:hypothetical protein
MKTLRVSDNRRFLVYEDGTPFFYLGDTAWELFHRLNREEADRYLTNRAERGFTVIQAVVLAELEGLTVPNPYGHLPLQDLDPTRPNEAYFEHVDYIVRKAESLGIFLGMLPTWGDKWNIGRWGAGPEIFTPENAYIYGEFLGRRYRDNAVIWILGGDRPVETDTHRAIICAMAAGVRAGDGGRHLISFHPYGQESSAQYFHEEPWLDFNMCQTGHTFNRDNYNSVAALYARAPIKPCLDAEPGYEGHPSGFNAENGYMDAYDARKFAYWGLFAGACGHTYGCHSIWQMWQPDRKPITAVRMPWHEAIFLPGAAQMQHARRLIESRPFLSRIPDQSLLLSDPGTGTDHAQATRDADGSYALIYTASGQPVTVAMEKIAGSRKRAYWYDPRTGEASLIDEWIGSEPREFTPPTQGNGQDWALALEDAERNFPPPGEG